MVLIAFLALVAILIIASVIDMVWGSVPNIITMLGVLVPSTILFIESTQSVPLLFKVYFMICIIVMYLGIMWAGDIMVTKGLIGGADIKILASLSPVLVAMGYSGALYLSWFFIINPAANALFARFGQGKSAKSMVLSVYKMRFVPIMSIVFVILAAVRFI